MYGLIRNLMFLAEPERVHYWAMNGLKAVCASGLARNSVAGYFKQEVPAFSKNLWELNFSNPVGLAAGFDKNAVYLEALEALGFSFVEIGTVTPRPQAGNPRPRLFRLPEDQAIINRMGFNNDGVKEVAARLKQWRLKKSSLIIGGNIGKNKDTPNEEAWKDYEWCFRELFEWVDYFVVNVSSPNTPGLRALQEKDALLKILNHLQTINQQQGRPKPLLLKIAPDLTDAQLQDIADIAFETNLDGLVATNTTISRAGLKSPTALIDSIGAGGLSGAPIRERSTAVVRFLHQATGGKIPIIAAGGIFTGNDALDKLDAGASLVQVWTGFIYEGPGIVKKICKHLQSISATGKT